MKTIRQIALTAMLTIGAFSAITYTSCNKDACADVVCQNGGTCTAGACTCATGYEGTNCETLSNAKYVGIWTAVENCNGTPGTYQVTITADPSGPNKVLINNLGNYGCTTGGSITWDATVNTTTLTINDNKCGYQINASGTYSNGTISINSTVTYTLTSGAVTDNCTTTLTK